MDKTKMLIDATHPEETRVVVVRNGRVEEFDFESASRKPIRGNIYLAKVTRVEPSLQAAFVEYGGNRHGFLAFSEIHPDYYQIPVADRELLKREEAEAEAAAEAEVDDRSRRRERRHRRVERPRHEDQPFVEGSDRVEDPRSARDEDDHRHAEVAHDHHRDGGDVRRDDDQGDHRGMRHAAADYDVGHDGHHEVGMSTPVGDRSGARSVDFGHSDHIDDVGHDDHGDGDAVEQIAENADALEELPERPRRRARQYKIQEVIKRRQIILVQVVKEERGNKGAALTTYISLAGRYTVLMPNTGRGGGISRKITQAQDRKRLKAIAEELDVAEGMGLIIRTAGAARTKQEIKRDYEYLLRLWESVRDLTLTSTAPCLVYEEGNLIKRSIRDLYTKDIDGILVSGDAAYREARDFMGMLMPGHDDHVISYDGHEPLLTRYGVERQLNAMFNPRVTLKSGGYIVINQTEALVAVDVNSGKSTREFSIEETALNTNLEAADEVARQLKLRDLAGLIVVDFIDMEEKRNNRSVERRMKDALRFDRARIQVGRISHFGLLEMSRQRLRTGVVEGSSSQCPHCEGTGNVRSTESVALAVLRALDDQLNRQPSSIAATTSTAAALFILNSKRSFISEMERRYGVAIAIEGSERMHGANFSVERTAAPAAEVPKAVPRAAVNMDWGFDGTASEVEAEDVPPTRELRRDVPEGARNLRVDHDEADDSDELRPRGGRDEGLSARAVDDGDGDGEEGGRSRRRRRRRGRRGRNGGDDQHQDRATGGGERRPRFADVGDRAELDDLPVSTLGARDEAREPDGLDDPRPVRSAGHGDRVPRGDRGGRSHSEAAGGEVIRNADDDVVDGKIDEAPDSADDAPGGDDRPRRGRRRGRRGGRARGRTGNEHGEITPGQALDAGDWGHGPIVESPTANDLPVYRGDVEPARNYEVEIVERRDDHHELPPQPRQPEHAIRPAVVEMVATEARVPNAGVVEQARLVEVVEPRQASETPVHVQPVDDAPDRPSRKGWWQRRFGGG